LASYKVEALFLTQQTDTTSNESNQQAQEEKQERGERRVENIRYGEAISEHGFGGETVGNSGGANQGSGFGGTMQDEDKDGEGGQMRREQGYGGGSNVGG
jgi:hypothetical protein